MSRIISSHLQNHVASETLTLATCWKITRSDGVVLGFTDNVTDIIFDTVTYQTTNSFEPTDILQRDDMSVDNMEVVGTLDSTAINEADLQVGLYDFASIDIFMVNDTDVTQGNMLLKRGWLGEVTIKNGQFTAEIRGLSQKLQQNIGRIFCPSCDAIPGDTRCNVNLANVTINANVTNITDNQIFTATGLTQENGWFSHGEIAWLSGNNAGVRMEVKEFSQSQVALVLPMAYSIQLGDNFDIIAGCDKSDVTCKNKFNNLLNFQGFPDIPGQDKILETSGTFE